MAKEITRRETTKLLREKLAHYQKQATERENENLELRKKVQNLLLMIDEEKSRYLEISADNKEVWSKYRAANSRYRTASQQISHLKKQLAEKNANIPGQLPKSEPHTPTSTLPDKKKKSKIGGNNFRLVTGLRYLKWQIAIPLASRLGVPEKKLAAIRLPRRGVKLQPQPLENRAKTIETAVNPVATATALVRTNEVFSPPSEAAQEIGILGWPSLPDNDKPIVLSVMDEFTEGCFGSDVRLLQPRPDNWYALAKKYPPAMVFIESAWKGNGGSWQFRVGTYAVQPGRELAQMSAWARQEKIPVILWNKEDPVHHEKFLVASALADHIFTTDQTMIGSYKQRTGNHSVHALPFAAQPALHRPAALDGRIRKTCFAGSWYGNRHAERGEAMKWLLKAAHPHGLDIYDRNFETGLYPFPAEYNQNIRGSLPYLELCKEYPRYRAFLNVNSVTESPTMFSRRVFELMACGTPVVSTFAQGIADVFKSDSVWMVRNEAEAKDAIVSLLEDDFEWRRRSLAGIREIFSHHTYAHRLNSVFEIAGIGRRISTDPKLLLLAHAHSQSELERLLAFAGGQHYKEFQILIACAPRVSAGQLPKQVKLVEIDNFPDTIEQELNTTYVAAGWILPQHHYGPHYLRDLANAVVYQPEVNGWAKACGQDAFEFGAQTRLAASIWKPEVFRDEWMDAYDRDVHDERLYCIDTDEFSAQI